MELFSRILTWELLPEQKEIESQRASLLT